jgi:hypothetical protein
VSGKVSGQVRRGGFCGSKHLTALVLAEGREGYSQLFVPGCLFEPIFNKQGKVGDVN